MEYLELQGLLSDPAKFVNKIEVLSPDIAEQAINVEPENHKVNKIEHRKQRAVEVPIGEVDENGDQIYKIEYRDVHRIPSATEKQIVDWAVRMALGPPIEIDCNPKTPSDKTMLAMIRNVFLMPLRLSTASMYSN